jgi:hypothetical protein
LQTAGRQIARWQRWGREEEDRRQKGIEGAEKRQKAAERQYTAGRQVARWQRKKRKQQRRGGIQPADRYRGGRDTADRR